MPGTFSLKEADANSVNPVKSRESEIPPKVFAQECQILKRQILFFDISVTCCINDTYTQASGFVMLPRCTEGVHIHLIL